MPEFYIIYARKKFTKCPNFTRFLPEKIVFAPVSYPYDSGRRVIEEIEVRA